MAGIVVRDASLDRRDAFVERVEDRILRPLPGQLREEPLDGVRPGRRGRGEAERPVGPALRPRADLCDETVSRMTCTGVPGAIPSATGSGKARNSCGRCRWRRRGPRAGRSCVIVPAWPGVTGRGLLRPPERLYPVRTLTQTGGVRVLALLHREADGMVGWVDAEADDVAGHPEGPDPVRPEAVLLQDAVQTIPGLPAGARTVRCRACGGGDARRMP